MIAVDRCRSTARRYVAAALVLLGTATGAAAGAAEPAERAITVTGHGASAAAPDVARVTAGVETEAPSARAAMQENSRRMARLIRVLRGLGIEARDVQTGHFSVTPVRDARHAAGARPEITGYRVSNVVTVVQRDVAALGELLDALVREGGNVVRGLAFDVADPAPLHDAALRAAIADARRQAELAAAEAGVGLGAVLRVEVHAEGRPRPVGMRAVAAEAGAVPVSPGETEVGASATVVYGIE